MIAIISSDKNKVFMRNRFVILGTAAFVVLSVGVAVVFGIAAHPAARKRWQKG